jgi:hypothetical protein
VTTGKRPPNVSRDGKEPAKRRQMEEPEQYGQVASKVSKDSGPSHPGIKARAAGTKHSGGVKGGERTKPGQMAGDEDKSAKD